MFFFMPLMFLIKLIKAILSHSRVSHDSWLFTNVYVQANHIKNKLAISNTDICYIIVSMYFIPPQTDYNNRVHVGMKMKPFHYSWLIISLRCVTRTFKMKLFHLTS